jgi:tripartite-type tricarboxylate transporter receptor subunit TctC
VNGLLNKKGGDMKRFIGMAACLLAAASAALPEYAAAQAYPSRPVRLITPYPAGSGTDTFLRALAQEFSKTWGQSVLVDNRAGASTIIAAEACARATADGYTLCMLDRGTLSTVPHLHKKLSYDPAKDFAPISHMTYLVSAIAVSPTVTANSMKELIEFARANPGKLNYSSVGTGTPPHLVIEWIKKKYDVNLIHIPFKSPSEMMQTLSSSEVQVTYFGLINLLGLIKGGKAKALAVSGEKRSPLLPDVPTLSEAGIVGLDDRVWFGLFAPAGTSKDIVNKVYRDLAKVFAQPEFREQRLIQQGWEPVASTPEHLAEFMKKDREVGAEMVKITGAQPQ